MIPLPRAMVKSVVPGPCNYDKSPIQSGLGRDPWKVIVSSQLLQRARRNAGMLELLLSRWPTPESLMRSDSELEFMLQPLGLHRTRTRQLQLMSRRWYHEAFDDVRDLPGCGAYVCDAVGLFCFGCTELDSSDEVLHTYAYNYEGPRMSYFEGKWLTTYIHDEWSGYDDWSQALKDYEEQHAQRALANR